MKKNEVKKAISEETTVLAHHIEVLESQVEKLAQISERQERRIQVLKIELSLLKEKVNIHLGSEEL